MIKHIVISFFFFLGQSNLGSCQGFFDESNIWDDVNISVELDNNGYIAFPDSSALDFSANSNISIDLWVRPKKSTSCIELFAKGDQYSIALRDSISGKYVQWNLGDSLIVAANTYTNEDSELLSADVPFYNIVCTYDGTNDASGMNIYINGKATTTTTIKNGGTPTLSGSDSLKIGASCYGVDFILARVYNSNLSAASVAELWSEKRPVATASYAWEYWVYQDSIDAEYWSPENAVITGLSHTNLKNYSNAFQSEITSKRYKMNGRQSRSIDAFNIMGGQASFDRPESYPSPVNGVFRGPLLWYDSLKNKTYFSTINRPGPEARSWLLSYFDHSSRVFFPQKIVPSITAFNRDNHQIPVIIRANDGQFVMPTEDQHNTVAYIHKSSDSTLQTVSYSGVTTPELTAYLNIFSIGDSLYILSRNGSMYNRQVLQKSTDSGVNWSDAGDIAIHSSGTKWLYPSFAYNYGDTIFTFILEREQGLQFSRIYALKTADGYKFESLSGSASKQVGAGQSFSDLDLHNCCIVDEVSDSVNYWMALMDSTIDTSGRINIVYHDLEDSLYTYAVWQDTGWLKKEVSIDQFTSQTVPTAALIYQGADSFDLFRIETRGGYDVVVKYSTDNRFTTIDAGEIVSKTNADYANITKTHNVAAGKKNIVAASEIVDVSTQTTYLWIYEY